MKSELKGDIKSVNTIVNKLTEDVTDLKRLKDDISTIKDLREDLASLKETLGEPNSNSSDVQELRKQLSMMESALESNKDETSRDITQREIRKTNIIAFNVPESKSDDPDNRKQHDQESILQLCREFKLDVEVVAVTRLQTSTNSDSTDKEKPKPLRIKVKTEQMRTLILSKARLLVKSENKKFQSIFLKRDATPLERAEMQRNRENRKRKEENPQQGKRETHNKVILSTKSKLNQQYK